MSHICVDRSVAVPCNTFYVSNRQLYLLRGHANTLTIQNSVRMYLYMLADHSMKHITQKPSQLVKHSKVRQEAQEKYIQIICITQNCYLPQMVVPFSISCHVCLRASTSHAYDSSKVFLCVRELLLKLVSPFSTKCITSYLLILISHVDSFFI